MIMFESAKNFKWNLEIMRKYSCCCWLFIAVAVVDGEMR